MLLPRSPPWLWSPHLHPAGPHLQGQMYFHQCWQKEKEQCGKRGAGSVAPRSHHGGGGGGGGEVRRLQMELLITLQQQMEPSGEYLSEKRTRLGPGCRLQDGNGLRVHLQGSTGCGTSE